MASERQRRVAEAMRGELADLIAREVKDPRVREGLVTINHIEVNRDLSVADVGISILAGDPKAVMAGLGKAGAFLRGPLARRLKLRVAPQLRFHHDKSQEISSRLRDIVLEDEERRRISGPHPEDLADDLADDASGEAADEVAEGAADDGADDVGEDGAGEAADGGERDSTDGDGR